MDDLSEGQYVLEDEDGDLVSSGGVRSMTRGLTLELEVLKKKPSVGFAHIRDEQVGRTGCKDVTAPGLLDWC